MKKLPFFIPFRGCSRRCVYCDQSAITGSDGAMEPDFIRRLVSAKTEPVEVCFFGGSFAGLPLPLLSSYLEATRSAPEGSRIRFSTYPTDLLDPQRLRLLEPYPISRVELGIPSLDAAVLQSAGRAETVESVTSALKLLSGLYPLGAQLMTGLPGQSAQSSLADIERLHEIKGSALWELRIYPCLVLKGTPLEILYQEGRYTPPALEEAVLLAGALIDTAKQRGFSIIRTGLQASLSLEKNIVAGPWHPAFGELATSAALALRLSRENPRGPWQLPRSEVSKFYGHGQFGLQRLARACSLSLKTTASLLHFYPAPPSQSPAPVNN